MAIDNKYSPLIKVITITLITFSIMYFLRDTVYLALIIIYLLANIYLRSSDKYAFMAVFRKYAMDIDSHQMNNLSTFVANYFQIVSVFLFLLHVFEVKMDSTFYLLVLIHLTLAFLIRKKIKKERS